MPPPITPSDLNSKKGLGWAFVTSFKMLGKDPKSYFILLLIGLNIYFIHRSNKLGDQLLMQNDKLWGKMVDEIKPIKEQVNVVQQQVDTTVGYVKNKIDSLQIEKKEAQK